MCAGDIFYIKIFSKKVQPCYSDVLHVLMNFKSISYDRLITESRKGELSI